MKLLTLILMLFVTLPVIAAETARPAAAENSTNRPSAQIGKTYELGPDSLPQEGVPKGKLEGPFLFKSQIFSNTVRH